MKNKLFTAVLSLSLLYPISQASASQNTPTLAILDTGIDTSLPKFQGKIIGEVCILEWSLCPNGTKFQEGPGSASMPSELISKNGFDHGTHMADVAISTNPNINILFIKIIANTSTGLRKPAGESTIAAALNWILENKEKYNVQAVSISQGTSSLGAAGTQYCPSFPRTVLAVDRLLALGVPLFSAVGNRRDYTRIDWPSCIPQVVAVGATDQINEIASYSNNDNTLLDFFALGNMQSAGPGNVLKNIAGTSASTQVVAAQYLSATNSYGYSGQRLIDELKINSISTTGRQGTFIKLFSTKSGNAVVAPSIKPPSISQEQLSLELAQKALSKTIALNEAKSNLDKISAQLESQNKLLAEMYASYLEVQKQVADTTALLITANSKYKEALNG